MKTIRTTCVASVHYEKNTYIHNLDAPPLSVVECGVGEVVRVVVCLLCCSCRVVVCVTCFSCYDLDEGIVPMIE